MPSGDTCPACRGPLSAWRSVTTSEPGLAGQLPELLAGLARRGGTIAVLARRV